MCDYDTTFVKSEKGLYHASGPITSDDIIRTAAAILQENLTRGDTLSHPEEAARFLQMTLANEKNEHFAVLFMNNKNQVLSFERLFSGTVDGATVHPRIVVQKALEWNAASVILAHNHPSGHSEPSQADRDVTQLLVKALGLIDVRVLDHLVVSQSGWESLSRRGWV
ncbi:MAG: DNA repair protein RadC [Alloalcanivorax venustensis]|jgi:DNA repair protein RadC|uniref:DNA repair protein RadC n=2 Tax=Alloalcanivorax TaxID=3020832 RepID=A0A9Q3URT4_9GAMM|nr:MULTISPECIES: DNA repair protein RadC [Alloalcanivorax]MBG13682.1 DNA repair protein RadC [Alcanivorax sp.]MBL4713271.1 DNA repair protein RadC [Alcanivorax sp.]MBM7335367.1 DNA repair protein RadC [Alloalcanivorax marinus]MCC4310459.1 DNA repair protein RadC [Alloalcanivorax marinus]MCH2559211.1 DNA repair protein RadC [Alcanivorax sp.]|tara:strand:+ start:224 stop:724 length:501 start_codon:yes stop_codon:yes gene_type:complete